MTLTNFEAHTRARQHARAAIHEMQAAATRGVGTMILPPEFDPFDPMPLVCDWVPAGELWVWQDRETFLTGGNPIRYQVLGWDTEPPRYRLRMIPRETAHV